MDKQNQKESNEYVNMESFCQSYLDKIQDIIENPLEISIPTKQRDLPKLNPPVTSNSSDANQYGGMTSEEFTKKIIVLEDRNILPNGLILHHDGRIEYPNNSKNSNNFDQLGGTSSWIIKKQRSNLYNTDTFKWLTE